MKARISNLSTRNLFLLMLPLIAVAYPLFRVVVGTVVHSVVPETVRTFLHLL